MQKLLILAAFAAVSIGQPVAAQPAPANPAIAVAHKDLDLRTATGAKALDRRIWRAVVEVCGTAPDFDIAGKNDVRHCRRDTKRVASAQAKAVVASAAREQLIQVSSIRN